MMWKAAFAGHLVEVKRRVEDGEDVNCTGGKVNSTPLHVAIRYKHTAVAEYLISLPGCDLEARNSKGLRALHHACFYHSNIGIVKILVHERADVNAGTDKGNTGLHLAIQKGHTAVAEYLISLPGCDLEARSSGGRTPLHHACYYLSNIDIVKMLVHKPVDVNARTDNGCTGLHLAIAAGHTAVVEYLISLPGCDLEARTSKGWTPLHFACASHSNIDIVKILVHKGADLNSGTDKGSTGLHLAILKGHTAVVEYLISQPGCDIDITNYDGKTALDIANKKRCILLKGLLAKRKGGSPDIVMSQENKKSTTQQQKNHLKASKQYIQKKAWLGLREKLEKLPKNLLKASFVKIDDPTVSTDAQGTTAAEENTKPQMPGLVSKASSLHSHCKSAIADSTRPQMPGHSHFTSATAHLVKNEEGIYYIRKSDITISNPNNMECGKTSISITSQPVTESEIPDGGQSLSKMITLEPHGMVFDKHLLVKFPINQHRYRSDQNVCLMYSDGSYGGDKKMHWVNLSQHTPAVHKDEMFWFINDGYCYLYTRHFSHIFLLQTADPVSPQHGIFLLVSLYAKYVKRKLVITVGFHCHRCFENLLEAKGNFGNLLDDTFYCVYDTEGPVTIHIDVDNNNDWECYNPEKKIHVNQLLPLCHLGAIYKTAFEFRAKGELNHHREVRINGMVVQEKHELGISATLCLKDISDEPATKDMNTMTDFTITPHDMAYPLDKSIELLQPKLAEMNVSANAEKVKFRETQNIMESAQATTDDEVMKDFQIITHNLTSSMDNSAQGVLQPELAELRVSGSALGVKSKVTATQNIRSFEASQQPLTNNAVASHAVGTSGMGDLYMHRGELRDDQYNSNSIITNEPVSDKSTVKTTSAVCTTPKYLQQPSSNVSGEPFLPQTQDITEDGQECSGAHVMQGNTATLVHIPETPSQISNILPHVLQRNQACEQIRGNHLGTAGFNQFYQNINYYINYDQRSSDLMLQLPETDCVFNRSVVSEQEKLCEVIDNDCRAQLADIAKAVGDTNGTVDMKNITALSLLQVWKIHVKEGTCTWKEFYDLLVRLDCQSAAQQLKVVCDKDSLVRGINKLKQDISLDSDLCGILLELDVINLAEYDEINLMKSPLEKISFLVLELLVKKPGNYTRVKGFYQAMDSTRYYSQYIRAFMLCPEDIINC